MNEQLITNETLKAYASRALEMEKHKVTEKGRDLFVSTLTAVSEQVENMRVKAIIGDFEVENDGPAPLGGSGNVITPMPLLLATIANCLEITALLYLSFLKLNVKSLKVKVEGTHDKRAVFEPQKEPLPGFYDLHYTWIIESNENHESLKEALQKVDEICPVKGTIRSQNIIQDVTYI